MTVSSGSKALAITAAFDPDALLAALPRSHIALLSFGIAVPTRRSFGDLSDYNGFAGKERMRTFGVAKWLMDVGAMSRPRSCGICSAPADQSHAENYYDLSSWIDICRSCHGRLHRRFTSPERWGEHLDRHELPATHWARLVSSEPFDLASLLRKRGSIEPTYASFVESGATQHSPPKESD